MKLLLLLLSALLFVSCSNMTVGFEEDSPFYSAPLIDTRADTDSQERETTKAKVEKEEATNQESQTTFTYERDDD